MATYQHKTDPSVYAPYIYQQPLELMAKDLASREAKYDSGVTAVANSYSNALNLEVGLQESQDFIDNKYKELKPEIEKMSTVDFSIEQNVTKATKLLDPIVTNPNIITDVGLNKFYKSQYATYNTYLKSTDPAIRELANSFNLEQVQNGYTGYKNGGWDGLGASAANKVAYKPYSNTGKNFMKFAKDGKLIQTIQSFDGDWLRTETNGKGSIAFIKGLYQASMSGSDREQLGIEADVLYERSRKPGESDLSMGKRAVESASAHTVNAIKGNDELLGKVTLKLNELNKKGKENFTPEDKKAFEEYSAVAKTITPMNEALKKSNEELIGLSDEDIVLKFGKQAFMNEYSDKVLDNLATSYAGATYSNTYKPNEINMQTRNFQQQDKIQAVSNNQRNYEISTKAAIDANAATTQYNREVELKKLEGQIAIEVNNSKPGTAAERAAAERAAIDSQGVPGDPDNDPLTNPQTVAEYNTAVKERTEDYLSSVEGNINTIINGILPLSNTTIKQNLGSDLLRSWAYGSNITPFNKVLNSKSSPELKAKQVYLKEIFTELQRKGLIAANVDLATTPFNTVSKLVTNAVISESKHIRNTGKSNFGLSSNALGTIRKVQNDADIIYSDILNLRENKATTIKALTTKLASPTYNVLERDYPGSFDNANKYSANLMQAISEGKIIPQGRGAQSVIRVENGVTKFAVTVWKPGQEKIAKHLREGETVYVTLDQLPATIEKNKGIDRYVGNNSLSKEAIYEMYLGRIGNLPTFQDFNKKQKEGLASNPADLNRNIVGPGSLKYGSEKAYNSFTASQAAMNLDGKFSIELSTALQNKDIFSNVTIYPTRNGKQKQVYEIDGKTLYETVKNVSNNKNLTIGQLASQYGLTKSKTTGNYTFVTTVPAEKSEDVNMQMSLSNGRSYPVSNNAYSGKLSAQPGTGKVSIQSSIKTIKTSGETVIINQDGSVQFEDGQRYLETRESLGNPVDLYNNLQADASNVSALYDLIHSKDAKEKVKAILKANKNELEADGTYRMTKSDFLKLYPSAQIFIK